MDDEDVQTWHPTPPDMSTEDFAVLIDKSPPGYPCIAYLKHDKDLIFKGRLTRNEYRIHKAAGTCAVEIKSRVLSRRKLSPTPPSSMCDLESRHCDQERFVVSIYGIVMPRERVLEYTTKRSSNELWRISKELIHLVSTLHNEFNIIHGDLKPHNILQCQDGKFRFCDFGEARMMSDEPEEWEGLLTDELAPPRRLLDRSLAPIISDDLYSLGLSIWMLYSNRKPEPAIEWTGRDTWRPVTPIDVELIIHPDICKLVRGYLAMSGVII